MRPNHAVSLHAVVEGDFRLVIVVVEVPHIEAQVADSHSEIVFPEKNTECLDEIVGFPVLLLADDKNDVSLVAYREDAFVLLQDILAIVDIVAGGNRDIVEEEVPCVVVFLRRPTAGAKDYIELVLFNLFVVEQSFYECVDFGSEQAFVFVDKAFCGVLLLDDDFYIGAQLVEEGIVTFEEIGKATGRMGSGNETSMVGAHKK